LIFESEGRGWEKTADALRSRNRWRLLFVMSMLGHIGWGIGAV
jgi:hypothetical protein